jgi:hypothetical protein
MNRIYRSYKNKNYSMKAEEIKRGSKVYFLLTSGKVRQAEVKVLGGEKSKVWAKGRMTTIMNSHLFPNGKELRDYYFPSDKEVYQEIVDNKITKDESI